MDSAWSQPRQRQQLPGPAATEYTATEQPTSGPARQRRETHPTRTARHPSYFVKEGAGLARESATFFRGALSAAAHVGKMSYNARNEVAHATKQACILVMVAAIAFSATCAARAAGTLASSAASAATDAIPRDAKIVLSAAATTARALATKSSLSPSGDQNRLKHEH